MPSYPHGPHAVEPSPREYEATEKASMVRRMEEQGGIGMRPLERVSSRLDESLQKLGAVVQELEQRLQPVMSPYDLSDPGPTLSSSVPMPQREETSPLASQMHDYADRISSITAHIGRLTRNIEA